jgi:hypothetical protein
MLKKVDVVGGFFHESVAVESDVVGVFNENTMRYKPPISKHDALNLF